MDTKPFIKKFDTIFKQLSIVYYIANLNIYEFHF